MIPTRFGPCKLVTHLRGDGPVLLGVPGIPGGPRDFKPLAEALERVSPSGKCPTVSVLTLPDGLHNHPSFPHAQRNLYVLSDFFEDVIEALGPQSIHLMGHSFGGALALMVAARFPKNVASFIGVNPVGLQRHPALTLPPRVWRAAYGPLFQTLGDFTAPLIRYAWTQRGVPSMDKISDDDVRKAIYWVGGLDFRKQRWAARQLACPSLVVGARNDKVVPIDYVHGLMAGLNKEQPAQLLVRKKGGHTLLIREPRWLAAAVLDFWRQHGFVAAST